MKEKELYEDILSDLDAEDEKYIIIDYDNEYTEPSWRWEYSHESLTEADSIFRRILPDK